MIVLDTSLIGPLAIPDEQPSLSAGANAALLGETIIVPHHWRLEVANMLRTAIRRKRMSLSARDETLTALAMLPVTVDRQTWAMAWSATIALSDRHQLTPYDAAYLELAARLSIPLATRDRALQRAGEVEQIVIRDYTF